MKKIGNVFKKVFVAIGHFFRNIWRYVFTNAWIQPILIVALIFALIFSLTFIPGLIESVKGWFDSSTDNKIKNRKVIDYDDFIKMYNNNESFFVVFGSEDCSNCKQLYKKINSYMKDEEHKEIVNAKIYFMNVTELIDDVEKDIEKYGGYDFAVKGENFDKLENLGTILYNGYEEVYESTDHYSSEESYGKSEVAYAIETPTTAFFTKDASGSHSKVFNIIKGNWTYAQDYSDINKLFECWHLSNTDYEAAVKTRNHLRDYQYIG